MNKAYLAFSAILAVVLLSVIGVVAQGNPMDRKPMPQGGMEVMAMHKDGHQALAMAYHHNAVAFTRALWQMSSDGNIENLDLARAAFAEIKRSVEKMEEVHQMHMSKMGKMDPAMMEKMKPMISKMEAEKAVLKGRIHALETVLQGSAPRAQDVETHSAALLMRLERMGMPDKKMAM